MFNQKPELLSPAGDMDRLKTAILYGADAVYLAGKAFGMRAGANNFSNEEIIEAVKYAHERNVKVYVTCNISPTDAEIDDIPEFFKFLKSANVDAIIVSDMGVLEFCKEYASGVDIHMSTQAGIVNYAAAKSLYNMGVRRVVLARELSLEQIKKIRDNTPEDLEIEAFVHGAMCMSFSGRCLISQYMLNRDANKGECAQPCRWKYHLVEEKKPNEFMPIFEDDGGTYIMNAKDMSMVEHVDKIIEAGVSSLKLEGRAKATYYVAVVTNAYRHAIDLYLKDPKNFDCPFWIKDEVTKVSHRNYTTGFYFGKPEDGQCYDNGGYLRNFTVVAIVDDYESGYIICTEKNKFLKGEELEIIEPLSEPFKIVVEELLDMDGNQLEYANHSEQKVKIKCSRPVKKNAFIRVQRDK
ncbi:MAG: peptidase U32 family protein [Oscillospiraceae bacterium]